MKVLVCSDFHGNTSIIDKIVIRFKETAPDIVCFCGDVVKGKARGTAWLKAQEEGKTPDLNTPEIIREADEDHEAYQSFFTALDKIGVPVLVVPGNMDAPEGRFFNHLFDYKLTMTNIRLVQENILYYGGFFFSGFGGEITESQAEENFVLQYPIQKVRFFMRKLCYLSGKKVLILHTPPQSKLDFEKGSHKGCYCVNEVIEWLKPDFVFCGHAHMASGEEWLGKSLIINPGPLKKGCFALLDTREPNVHFEKI